MAADSLEPSPMRKESVAEGIKRRMAEKETARRKGMDVAVQIAIWGAVIASCVATTAALVTFSGWRW
jgi:hypothetical protein